MAGAAGTEEGRAAAPGEPTRDYVTFYSRLTQTLEKALGAEGLAGRLAEARRAAGPDAGKGAAGAAAAPWRSAAARVFRRVGWLRPGEDAARFLDAVRQRLADAVSRPAAQVDELLRLFSAGDDSAAAKAICGATPYCRDCLLTRCCDYYNNPRKPVLATMSPAERLMTGNDRALSDPELLAVALYGERGTGQEAVVANLLSRYGRLRAVFRAEPGEYLAIRDVSPALALRLSAYAALYRRLLVERRDAMLIIASARDIYDRYAAELREYRVEAAVLLMLDQQNNVIRDAWFCSESPNSAQVRIGDLLRPAVREYAVRVALVHNHPSGSPRPSREDDEFTRRLAEACAVFDLYLVDHVIVTDSSYFSYAEEGLLDAWRSGSPPAHSS